MRARITTTVTSRLPGPVPPMIRRPAQDWPASLCRSRSAPSVRTSPQALDTLYARSQSEAQKSAYNPPMVVAASARVHRNCPKDMRVARPPSLTHRHVAPSYERTMHASDQLAKFAVVPSTRKYTHTCYQAVTKHCPRAERPHQFDVEEYLSRVRSVVVDR